MTENAAAQEFLSYMSENVFDPTGRNGTVVDRVVPIIANRWRYYTMQDGQLVNSPRVDS